MCGHGAATLVAQTLVSAAPRLVSVLGPSLDTSVVAARKSACATQFREAH